MRNLNSTSNLRFTSSFFIIENFTFLKPLEAKNMAKHLTSISSSALINRFNLLRFYCVKSEPKNGNCQERKNLKCVGKYKNINECLSNLGEEKKLKWL